MFDGRTGSSIILGELKRIYPQSGIQKCAFFLFSQMVNQSLTHRNMMTDIGNYLIGVHKSPNKSTKSPSVNFKCLPTISGDSGNLSFVEILFGILFSLFLWSCWSCPPPPTPSAAICNVVEGRLLD